MNVTPMPRRNSYWSVVIAGVLTAFAMVAVGCAEAEPKTDKGGGDAGKAEEAEATPKATDKAPAADAGTRKDGADAQAATDEPDAPVDEAAAAEDGATPAGGVPGVGGAGDVSSLIGGLLGGMGTGTGTGGIPGIPGIPGAGGQGGQTESAMLASLKDQLGSKVDDLDEDDTAGLQALVSENGGPDDISKAELQKLLTQLKAT